MHSVMNVAWQKKHLLLCGPVACHYLISARLVTKLAECQCCDVNMWQEQDTFLTRD